MLGIRAAVIAVAVLVVTAPSAGAQGLNEQQLRSKFEKHRGLVPAPKGNAAKPAPKGATVKNTNQSQNRTNANSQRANAKPVKSKAEPATRPYVPIKQSDAVNIQVLFDYDSAVLRADQRPKLSSLCNVIREMKSDTFQIVGHTDAAGPASYNRRLSRLRAEEVARYLTVSCGISANRLRTLGVGEEYLFDPGKPLSGQNRRVEFQLLS
ncbi:MAG: OmpA family protein [Pseudomonadota bacterium]